MTKNKETSMPIVGLNGPGVSKVPLDQALSNIGSIFPQHQGQTFTIPSPEPVSVELPVTVKQGR